MSDDGTCSLWDWRRRVASLYARVREAPEGEAGWAIWRTARDGLFRTHPQSPIESAERARFAGLPLFPYDPALRFAVRLQPRMGEAFAVAAGADGDVCLRPFARTVGLAPTLGEELTVFWIEGYGGGAFLPFADATSGVESYGGGRYLLDTIKGADLGQNSEARTILDFNFAYNPSCSYSSRYTCPLSPPVNRLLVAVRGGERV